MSSFRGWHVVTNGDHTDNVVQHVAAGSTFETALEGRRHETDAPNYTPRIAGLVRLNGEETELKLAKIVRDPGDVKHSVHCFYRYAGFVNGFGACIHTYAGDGNPAAAVRAATPTPYPSPAASTRSPTPIGTRSTRTTRSPSRSRPSTATPVRPR